MTLVDGAIGLLDLCRAIRPRQAKPPAAAPPGVRGEERQEITETLLSVARQGVGPEALLASRKFDDTESQTCGILSLIHLVEVDGRRLSGERPQGRFSFYGRSFLP